MIRKKDELVAKPRSKNVKVKVLMDNETRASVRQMKEEFERSIKKDLDILRKNGLLVTNS
ncbi:hypothetical protein [Microbulbifer sediminum]|uniref:hypothetical protein n=1 Tax=Microbulbifer sediminum TaxID=2904250 RepID=UPI001F434871|nr:hypothetical protein [Microbulbifer sediminum]